MFSININVHIYYTTYTTVMGAEALSCTDCKLANVTMVALKLCSFSQCLPSGGF